MSVRKRNWRTRKGEIKEAWVVDYTYKHGQHIKTYSRKKDADDFQATVKVDIRKGLHISPSKSLTVGEGAESWIGRVRANGMSDGPAEASTLRQHRQQITSIAPRIGTVKFLYPDKADNPGLPGQTVGGPFHRPRPQGVHQFQIDPQGRWIWPKSPRVFDEQEKRTLKIEAGRDFPTTAEVSG